MFNYVTEGTFDAYLWQTLENKQRFISQIMTSKSPVRSCEDVDEQALSYAEIKALCAGNPLIKEKMDLDVQVAKLKVLKADHQSQKFRLQDKLLTKFPADIQEANAHIAGLKADAQLAAAHPQGKEEFCGMTIKGVAYDEKKTAGERLVLACSELPNAEEKVIGPGAHHCRRERADHPASAAGGGTNRSGEALPAGGRAGREVRTACRAERPVGCGRKREKRDEIIILRTTKAEKNRIYEKMLDMGIRSLSAYIRKMALDGYCLYLDLKELRRMAYLLQMCSNNLNQYAKRANECGRSAGRTLKFFPAVGGLRGYIRGDILAKQSLTPL